MEDKKVIKKRKDVHLVAKREMAREKVRMLGRKKITDPRVTALEKAAQAWKNKKKVQVEIGRPKEIIPALEIVDIKPEKYKTKGKKQPENQGVADWLRERIRDFQKKSGREKEKSSKKSLNSASIGAIARRLMVREKAKMRGKRLPYLRISSSL